MTSRAPVRVFLFHSTAVLTCKHIKTSDMRLYSCPISLSQLMFPAVCVSHRPWWTQRRPLSPEACGAARTGHHADLWRAARPYCNAALPELCAAYGRSRLQPDRKKEDQHSMLSLTVCWRWRRRLFLCRCLMMYLVAVAAVVHWSQSVVDSGCSVLVERLASGLRLQVAVPQGLHHGLCDFPLDLKQCAHVKWSSLSQQCVQTEESVCVPAPVLYVIVVHSPGGVWPMWNTL